MKVIKLLSFFLSFSLFTTVQLFAQKTPMVFFYAKDHVTLDEAVAICDAKNWQLATPRQVKEAWAELGLDQYAYGMMSDGRFAVPVQKDYPNFKKDPNIGATGGNQGFFYIDLSKLEPDERALFSEVIEMGAYNIASPESTIPKRGNLRFKNRGAFTLVVEKYLDGKKVQDYEITAGLMKQFFSPKTHGHAIYKGYVITGLVWDPKKVIFEVERGNGDLTIETHGTTLNHYHKEIR